MNEKMAYSLNRLIRALADDCYGDQAADMLISVVSTLITRLVNALDHPDCDVRHRAVLVLGELRKNTDSIIPALMPLLGDADELVAQSTADALARIGTPAIPALIEALGSDDTETRFYAATALADVPELPTASMPSLIDAIIAAAHDAHCGVRFVASEVVEMLGRQPPVQEDKEC